MVHDLAIDEKICDFGCQLKRMGEETSGQFEVYPKRAFVTRHFLPKYICPGRDGVEGSNEQSQSDSVDYFCVNS